MRHTFRILIYLWTLSPIPGAFAGEVDGSAVIGGAVGGGLGAAAGSYVGGREGAIVGSAVGAAAGTAIATHDYGGEDLKRNESSDHEIVYVTTDRKTTGKKGKGCPPGLRMQGRC
jgi:outer membrane lipoprotein SlyB